MTRKRCHFFYQINDKVYLKNFRQSGGASNETLTPSWKGPFRITGIKPPNVEIEMENKKSKWYHAKLIKPSFSQLLLILTSILACFCPCTANEIYKIQTLNNSQRLFFHKLGQAMNHVDTWHMITKYNLSDLAERLTSITQISSSKTKETQLRTAEDLLSNLPHVVDHDLSINDLNTRKKREGKYYEGMLPWIGSIASWVLGTATERDINKVEGELKDEVACAERGLTLFDQYLTNEKCTREMISRNALLMNAYQNNTKEELRNLKTKRLLDLQTTLIVNEISDLTNAILLAKRKLVHPSLVKYAQLKKVIHKALIPKSRVFPYKTLNVPLEEYLSTCDIQTAIVNNILFYVIELPLTELQGFNMFRLLPLPLQLQPSLYSIRLPSSPFLLINHARDQYSTQENLRECIAILPKRYLCTLHTLSTELTCEVELLQNLDSNCNFEEARLIAETFVQLDESSWLFVTEKQNNRVQFLLSNDTAFYAELPPRGILTVTSRSTIITPNQVLVPHRTFRSVETHPLLDLPDVFHEIRSLPNITLPRLKILDTSTLTKLIGDTRMAVQKQQSLYDTLSDYSWHVSILSIVSSCLIFYCILRCCCNINLFKFCYISSCFPTSDSETSCNFPSIVYNTTIHASPQASPTLIDRHSVSLPIQENSGDPLFRRSTTSRAVPKKL